SAPSGTSLPAKTSAPAAPARAETSSPSSSARGALKKSDLGAGAASGRQGTEKPCRSRAYELSRRKGATAAMGRSCRWRESERLRAAMLHQGRYDGAGGDRRRLHSPPARSRGRRCRRNEMSPQEQIVAGFAPTGTLRAAINLGNPILAGSDPSTGAARGVSVDLAREL